MNLSTHAKTEITYKDSPDPLPLNRINIVKYTDATGYMFATTPNNGSYYLMVYPNKTMRFEV